jgi:hypothetical protein
VQDTTLTKWSTVQRTVHGPSTVQKPSRPVQVRSRYDPGTVQIRSNSTIHGPATIQTVRSTVWTVQTVEPLDRSWTVDVRHWTVPGPCLDRFGQVQPATVRGEEQFIYPQRSLTKFALSHTGSITHHLHSPQPTSIQNNANGGFLRGLLASPSTPARDPGSHEDPSPQRRTVLFSHGRARWR